MSAKPRIRLRARRLAAAFLLVLLAGAGWFVLEGGRYLQHEDPLTRSDAAFVLAGARVERWLEAVDLYREGDVPVIVLSPGRPEPSEVKLRQMGIRFPSESDLSRDAIVQLGVPASAVYAPDVYVDNTAQEAALLRDIARRRGWHHVTIVTSKYHTRRAGFAFRRALKGTGIEILMHATRYDTSDPARWWRSRPDVRSVTAEWQKLIAYWLGLAE